MIILSAILVAASIVWAGRVIAGQMAAARADAARARAMTLLNTFAPAIAAATDDPRALLVWQPLARAARELYPEEFARLDRAIGATFPFSSDRLQAAHAQWTADWLAWERAHDAEYKRKAAEAEQTSAALGVQIARGRVEAIEREKLDRYQRRYEEYVRVAKALQALVPPKTP